MENLPIATDIKMLRQTLSHFNEMGISNRYVEQVKRQLMAKEQVYAKTLIQVKNRQPLVSYVQ